MIEQALYFALGFLVMGFLGLLFLPFYWRRAVRLSTRRLEAQLPLSMAEIYAERDALRAEFAAHARRIEQRAEAALEARAGGQVELGRQTMLIGVLQSDFEQEKARSTELELALAGATHRQREAEAGLSAAIVEIYDATGMATTARDRHQQLHQQHQELIQLADSQRTTIAALDTRAQSLDIRLEDATHALDVAESARQAREHDLQKQGEKLAGAADSLADLERQRGELEARLVQAANQCATLENDVLQRAQVLAGVDAELADATLKIKNTEAQLAEALRRERDLRASLQRQMDMARASNANLAKRIDTLREENLALHGSLDALKAARTEAPVISKQPPLPDGDDAQLLRGAIADLGREMVRLTQRLDQEGSPNTPLPEKMQKLQARAARAPVAAQSANT